MDAVRTDPESPSTSRAPAPVRHRHRKPKAMSAAARRALVLAATAPVAGAVLAGPSSAFAADKSTAAAATVPDAAVPVDDADSTMAAKLAERVNNPSLAGDGTLSGVVLDSASDKVIWGHNASTALMPASNAKLATATAALNELGPEARFTTKVVYSNGTLTLIGDGDRTLSGDDLGEMAQTAVDGLKAAGVTNVKVAIDDSLFPEPTMAEGWRPDYYDDQISPVRALSVDGKLSADTALDAGKVFAAKLADRGVTVDGDVTRGKAGTGDVPVAQKLSPTVAELIRTMLKHSDNDMAETLLRKTALKAGQPATFEGGTAAVRQVLGERYGIPLDNVVLHDGSGLSRATRIPAATIAAILDNATEPRNQYVLGPILDGLPVAGEAGSTLGPEYARFDDPNSKCAVNKVRAKTGTLTGAVALSGLTQGKDGRWKVFSFVENNSTAKTSEITDAMDGLAATVNGCWA
ncbi:D-alanyl-D-alanine carboxypeptidase/D-alanyl-D-alanine-endopeptidase [Streptomyces sp. NPDC005962]|uniref:D-alanyl-D-alanine carboxypeptidase/D-alanyl-D-alanine endopeptidase n=1 Tax=Streptomyces sp. NPDC005962 TaxID=3154466 RepID=UPI0033C7018F